MNPRTRRVTYANIASTLALAIALGSGGAYAAGLARNSVGSRQIVNHSIKGHDIRDNTVTGANVADGSLTSADVADGSLTAADVAAGVLPTSLPGKIIVQRVDVALPAGAPGAPVSGFIACQPGQKLI